MRLYLKLTNKNSNKIKLVDTSFLSPKEVLQVIYAYSKSGYFKVEAIFE